MLKNKSVLLYFITTLLTVVPIYSQVTSNYLAVKKKGITVKGGTTVGSFKCTNSIYKPDTLYFTNYKKNSNLAFKIKTADIDCSNKLLNKDVYSTLKADEYPTIDISLSELKKVSTYYTVDIVVKIVGKTLKYNDVILTKSGNNIIGNVKLTFSELGLIPKPKMGGLIKIKDNIIISFNSSY